MPPYLLMMTQQDAVFVVLTRAGLDPRDFYRDEVRSRYIRLTPPVSRLNRRDSGYYFIFDAAEEEYRPQPSRISIFSPGSNTREEVQSGPTWEHQLMHVVHWIDYLKRELRAPNLWASLSEIRGPLALEGPDTGFTAEEKAEIFRRLDGLQRQIAAQAQLSVGQQRLLEHKFEEIKGSLDHLRRHQWFDLAVGAMMHFLFEAHIVQPLAQALFTTALTIFHSIANLPPALPPGR